MLRKQKRKDGECVMSCIAIKNATIVTVNERNEVIYDGTVIFENDRIKYVGKTKNAGELLKNVDEIIDGNGKILTPGIVNVHTHVMGNVFRGMTEDGPYDFIYRKCFPMESYLNEENAYWLSMNGCIETLKFGSVLINDLFHFASQTARAVDQIGMRAILEHKVYDVKSLANVQNMDYSRNYEAGKKRLEENEKLICDWNGKANGRIHCWVGNHAPDTNSPQLLKEGRDLADKYGVGIHMHVAQLPNEHNYIREEYGKTSIEFLDDLGVLRDDVVCAHLVYASDSDIKIMERTGAKFAHCPVIISKSGHLPKVKALLDSKIPMALGNDWVVMNPWDEMRAAVEMTRIVTTGDETAQNAQRVFRMMTIDGANLLNMGDDLGSLEVGKKADILVIDKNRSNLTPMRDVVETLVYNMTGNEIEKVIINGETVVKDGTTVNVDEGEVVKMAQKYSEEIWRQGGIWPL